MVRLALAAVAAGCVFIPAANAMATTLAGAGSSLVAPIEAEWQSTWDGQTGNTVTYNSEGSGKGEADLAQGNVQFAGSDAPLSAYTHALHPCTGCIMVPWALTATGVSYNVSGVNKPLKLTGGILAAIYLNHVHFWDDAAIKRINPGVNLPHAKIAVFYRSDGSGDSYAFTNFLSANSSAFASKFGPSVNFNPSSDGCNCSGAGGNSGMVTAVQTVPNSIAYIAVSYIINANLPAALIRNPAGRYEPPNLSNIESDAVAVGLPSNWQNNGINLTRPPRSATIAFPISTFTYAFAPKAGVLGSAQVSALKAFIKYAISPSGGQQFAASLDFAKLPKNILQAAEHRIGAIH